MDQNIDKELEFAKELLGNNSDFFTSRGISILYADSKLPIAVGDLSSKLLKGSSKNGSIVIGFNSNDILNIEAIVNNLFNLDGINLNIISDNNLAYSKMAIFSKNQNIGLDKIIETIKYSVSQSRYFQIDPVIQNMMSMLKDVIDSNLSVNVVLKNVDGYKKIGMALDNSELLDYARDNNLTISNEGKIIFRNIDEANLFFSSMKGRLANINNNMFESSDNEVLLPGESKVDFYEKMVRDENGNDVIVRLSVVKQNDLDSKFERFANITYINQETGEISSSSSVYAFNDAYKFDSNVLPEILALNSFNKNKSLSGKNVKIDDDPRHCYIEDESINSTNNKYNLDDKTSILQVDRENNIFGNSENVIDASYLDKRQVIEYMENFDGVTFENEVSNSDSEEYSNNPKLQKKLGEYPVGENISDNLDESGNVNFLNLGLFLAIDIISIAVGIFLLLH